MYVSTLIVDAHKSPKNRGVPRMRILAGELLEFEICKNNDRHSTEHIFLHTHSTSGAADKWHRSENDQGEV
jgi:hypothetical protein